MNSLEWVNIMVKCGQLTSQEATMNIIKLKRSLKNTTRFKDRQIANLEEHLAQAICAVDKSSNGLLTPERHHGSRQFRYTCQGQIAFGLRRFMCHMSCSDL